jgi:hypothetical protein
MTSASKKEDDSSVKKLFFQDIDQNFENFELENVMNTVNFEKPGLKPGDSVKQIAAMKFTKNDSINLMTFQNLFKKQQGLNNISINNQFMNSIPSTGPHFNKNISFDSNLGLNKEQLPNFQNNNSILGMPKLNYLASGSSFGLAGNIGAFTKQKSNKSGNGDIMPPNGNLSVTQGFF